MLFVNKDNFNAAYNKVKESQVLFFDIETSGLDVMHEDKICGIGIITFDNDEFYFPVEELGNTLFTSLVKIFEEDRVLIGHNIKFDMKGLIKAGANFSLKWILIDTQVMARLNISEKFGKFSLKSLIDRHLPEESSFYKDDLKETMKSLKIKKHSEVPINILSEYCINDVRYTKKLFEKFLKGIIETKQQNIWKLDIETTKVLLRMETTGVKIDKDYCNRAIILVTKKMKELESKIYLDLGSTFNIGSTKQLNEAFNSIGIKSLVKTDKGNPKWDSASLFMVEHPSSKSLLNWRSLEKLDSTYFGPMYEYPSDIVYCSFKNWRTITGRLACSEPNLQNIPRTVQNLNEEIIYTDERMKFAKQWAERGIKSGKSKSRKQTFEIYEDYDEDRNDIVSARRVFIPREGYTLFAMDFSQMEIRVFLSYINNVNIQELLNDDDFDFHTFIAKEVYKCKETDKDFKFFRQVSKEITYGIIYGMGLETLSYQMGTTKDEAREFRKKYFDIIPESQRFMKLVVKKIENTGHIHNKYGREFFIDPSEAYLGVNYLVQGTSGDLTKERMIALFYYIFDKPINLLIQIHDEFIIEIRNDSFSLLPEVVKILENNSLNIPIKLDVSICKPSWAQKEKIKDVSIFK